MNVTPVKSDRTPNQLIGKMLVQQGAVLLASLGLVTGLGVVYSAFPNHASKPAQNPSSSSLRLANRRSSALLLQGL
jgi:hypothetical protein